MKMTSPPLPSAALARLQARSRGDVERQPARPRRLELALLESQPIQPRLRSA
jgi:hypothetical protein